MINEFIYNTRRLFLPPVPQKKKENEPAGECLTESQMRLALSIGARLEDAGALKHRRDIEGSSLLLRSLGLPSHHDRQKDWDTLKVLYRILEHTTALSPVLDAGSGGKSVILKWLSKIGYRNLYACDRFDANPQFYSKNNIHFSVQDLAALNYENEKFEAISCVSVIEHGVDLDVFFKEMARVLKPGGYLLVSTDYWSEPVDCSGIYPYGKEYGEMKVFRRSDAEHMLELAAKHGLAVEGKVDLTTQERCVRWDRVDREYTFLFLPFRKATS